MTVMSEGLLLNSKYIKMGREEGVFKRHGLNPFKNKTKKVIHYNTKEHTYWHILLKNIHVTDFYPLNCFDVRIDRFWH